MDISILRITTQIFGVCRVSEIDEDESRFASRVTRASANSDGIVQFFVNNDIVCTAAWEEINMASQITGIG